MLYMGLSAAAQPDDRQGAQLFTTAMVRNLVYSVSFSTPYRTDYPTFLLYTFTANLLFFSLISMALLLRLTIGL
jgi:hypothetical protein